MNEDTTLSQPVQFDFIHWGKSQITELILTVNLPLNNPNRLVWTIDENQSSF